MNSLFLSVGRPTRENGSSVVLYLNLLTRKLLLWIWTCVCVFCAEVVVVGYMYMCVYIIWENFLLKYLCKFFGLKVFCTVWSFKLRSITHHMRWNYFVCFEFYTQWRVQKIFCRNFWITVYICTWSSAETTVCNGTGIGGGVLRNVKQRMLQWSVHYAIPFSHQWEWCHL